MAVLDKKESVLLARTLFYTGAYSYGFFLLLDLLRSQMVSRAFFTHWFLIPTVIGVIWWLRMDQDHKENRWWGRVLLALFTLVFLVLLLKQLN